MDIGLSASHSYQTKDHKFSPCTANKCMFVNIFHTKAGQTFQVNTLITHCVQLNGIFNGQFIIIITSRKSCTITIATNQNSSCGWCYNTRAFCTITFAVDYLRIAITSLIAIIWRWFIVFTSKDWPCFKIACTYPINVIGWQVIVFTSKDWAQKLAMFIIFIPQKRHVSIPQTIIYQQWYAQTKQRLSGNTTNILAFPIKWIETYWTNIVPEPTSSFLLSKKWHC